MATKFLLIGALLGFTGVAAGAFGAHGLKGRLESDMLTVFELAVRYQLYHALVLLALGAGLDHLQPPQVLLLHLNVLNHLLCKSLKL